MATMLVTMPVWASLILLCGARLTSYKLGVREPIEIAPPPQREHKPAAHEDRQEPCPICPAAPGHEAEAEKALREQLMEEQSLRRQAQDMRDRLSQELSDTKKKLAAMTEHAREMETTISSNMGPSAWLLQNFLGPHIAAVLAGFFGLAGVAGPMTYLRMYKLFLASTVGGVMLASSLGYYADRVGNGWVDVASAILNGDGNFGEYFVIFLMNLFGWLRYWRGWDWVLYAYVDDAYLARPVVQSGLKEPLLGPAPAEAPRGSSPPPKEPAPQDNFNVLMGMEDDHGGDVEANSAVDRMIQVTRRDHHIQASRTDEDWFYDFWADISMELTRGEVHPRLIMLLMQHGYNPQSPREAQPPSLLHLNQALEDFKMTASPQHHDYAAHGSYEGGDMDADVDEV